MTRMFASVKILTSLGALASAYVTKNQDQTKLGYEFVLNPPSEDHFLHTISAHVGTPAQETNFLIDLNEAMTHVFTDRAQSYLTRVDKFFSQHESSTARYLNNTNTFESNVCGIETMNYHVADTICLQPNASYCYGSDMYATYQITRDSWLNSFDLSEVGGILGVGRNNSNDESNAFWKSVAEHKYQAHDKKGNSLDYLWLHLRPSQNDYQWLQSYNASAFNATDFNSTMSLGTKIRNTEVKLQLPSEMPDHLIFSIDSLKFGHKVNQTLLFPYHEQRVHPSQQQQ